MEAEEIFGDEDVLFEQVEQLGAQAAGDHLAVAVGLEHGVAVAVGRREVGVGGREHDPLLERPGAGHRQHIDAEAFVELEDEDVFVGQLRPQHVVQRGEQERGALPRDHQHHVLRSAGRRRRLRMLPGLLKHPPRLRHRPLHVRRAAHERLLGGGDSRGQHSCSAMAVARPGPRPGRGRGSPCTGPASFFVRFGRGARAL